MEKSSTSPEKSPEKSLAERLHVLRLEYLASLPEKALLMQQAWASWHASPTDAQAVDNLYRLAHQLAGSGATFGCQGISDSSREIMVNLAAYRDSQRPLNEENTNEANISAENLSAMQAAFAHFNAVIAACSVGATAAPTAMQASANKNEKKAVAKKEEGSKEAKLIYLVDDDAEFSARIAAKLQDYGYLVVSFESLTAFEAAIARTLPDVVLMDMMLHEGPLAGAEAAQALHSQVGLQDIPFIFLTVRDDLEARLAAVRAGTVRYLTKPVDMLALRHTLALLLRNIAQSSYRVLLVDDDEIMVTVYRSYFERAGLQVDVLFKADGVLEKLATMPPDLILMDINMPGINGLEMAAVIRQFDAYLHIPIVFMSAERGKDTRLATMRLGADDFLSKPVAPSYLLEVLRTRIDKSRTLKSGESRVKKAIQELQEFKAAEDKHSIISVADTQGNIIEVNSKFSKISGYSKEELLGKNHRILKSSEHPLAFYEEMWSNIASGKVWHGQVKNRKKDGGFYWVDATITPILDEFGVPEKYISVRTDITHLKKLEFSLQEGQARLNLAMEATSTGFWEWNLSSNETFYSDHCRLLLGYALDYEISWLTLIHEDDFAAVFEQLIKHMNGEADIYHSEHRKRNAAGGWDWVFESGKIIAKDDNGEALRIIGTLALINERKNMEATQDKLRQQLLQAAKMEAIGHLTSGVAHDFNNILGGIMGYTELATAMLLRENPKLESIQRYLAEVQTAGLRAKQLVEQMLVFSRTGSDNPEDETPAISLQPVFKEVISLLHSTIPSSIKLNFHLPEQALQAAIQPVHLHQILLNLGVNARDAVGQHGNIDFSLSQHSFDHALCTACNTHFSGQFVDISVKDSGSGIPPDILQNIFTRFFTTKEAGKGTGIGLSMVHDIAHSLGGHILIESGTEIGTTVHILLPQSASAESIAEQTATAINLDNPLLRGIRIMVVDDEHTMASMLTELLSMHGATVTTFTESPLALHTFLQQPTAFDIVITDEVMPSLTGMDMSTLMLQQRRDLPIVLCTGYSENATPETVALAGIAAFMRKPLNIPELIAHIQRLTGHS